MLTLLSRTVGFVIVTSCALVGACTILENIAAWKTQYDHNRRQSA